MRIKSSLWLFFFGFILQLMAVWGPKDRKVTWVREVSWAPQDLWVQMVLRDPQEKWDPQVCTSIILYSMFLSDC